MSRLLNWLADRQQAAASDRGSTVVETVIIAAGLAALAIATVAAITLLVDGNVAGISL
jgi:hypothetical protein